MNFIAPYMLWGAAAASVPVIIHLFFRSRYRTVPWAAMKFLLTSIEQTSRRLRFQEILLLLARICILVLLALALARPISSAFNTSGRGEAIDAVFLFDNSLSMGTKEGIQVPQEERKKQAKDQVKDLTRLDKAKIAAKEIIDRLPPYSTVQIVTCSDRPEYLGPRIPSDLALAKAKIDKIQVHHLGTDFLPGIKESLAVLKRRQVANKEFYLFSDMQKNGWETQESPLKDAFRQANDEATIYMVHCGKKLKKNAAVIGITPQKSIPQPGERVSFAVLVKNTGQEDLEGLNVHLWVDGVKIQEEGRSIDFLKSQQVIAVSQTAKFDTAGPHVISASVEHDDLEADNRLDQVILVREYVHILVINGKTDLDDPRNSESFYLEHALLAVPDTEKRKYQFQLDVITPSQAVPGVLKDKAMCILANVSLEEDLKRPGQNLTTKFLIALDQFVREGHSLMVFPGEYNSPEELNRVMVKQYGWLPFEITDLKEWEKEEVKFLNHQTASLPLYKPFKEDKIFERMDLTEIYKYFRVKEQLVQKDKKKENKAKVEKDKETEKDKKKPKAPDKAEGITVALRYNNGDPAIIAHKVDAGEVMFFTSAAHPGKKPDSIEFTWNNWPVLWHFVPLVRNSVFHLLQNQTQSFNTKAGTSISWFVNKEEAGKSFTLYQPDGDRKRLGIPETVEGRPVVKLENLPLAGVYRFVSGDSGDVFNDVDLAERLRKGTAKIGYPFAVAPDLSETANLESLTKDQIDSYLGFEVIHIEPKTDFDSYASVDRTNREWTIWILLAVLFVTFGEGILAWFCGRPIGG